MIHTFPSKHRRLVLGLIALTFSATSSRAGQAESSGGELRLTPPEFDFAQAAAGGTGTSGVAGIQTVLLKGDPDGTGLYTILLKVPPHTRILAHDHPDDRVATVVSGIWRLGYGDKFESQKLKELPPGSFYTEPASRAHFAETGESGVVLQITGVGPSGLRYTDSEIVAAD
jgi:quercetin dioxygenase-like cupin family protein